MWRDLWKDGFYKIVLRQFFVLKSKYLLKEGWFNTQRRRSRGKIRRTQTIKEYIQELKVQSIVYSPNETNTTIGVCAHLREFNMCVLYFQHFIVVCKVPVYEYVLCVLVCIYTPFYFAFFPFENSLLGEMSVKQTSVNRQTYALSMWSCHCIPSSLMKERFSSEEKTKNK